FSSRRRHTRFSRDWSSDVCSSDLQLNFVEVFLKNSGSIKAIEKDLNISYPTVKKLLNEVLNTMGYDVSDDINSKDSLKRQEILDKLAAKEISYEEATNLLKNLR